MGKYWNGYRWCDDPPMARMEPKPIEQHKREALLEAELNPRTKTEEREPPMVEFDVSDVPVDALGEPIEEGKPFCSLVIEQPTPNMVALKPVITDEVRERVRRELKAKDDETA